MADSANLVLVLQEPSDSAIHSVNLEVRQQVTPLPLFNVVGMIPGNTKPDEYVIFSAHYDHLGIVPPVGQDSIANGADDDASGTPAVISWLIIIRTTIRRVPWYLPPLPAKRWAATVHVTSPSSSRRKR